MLGAIIGDIVDSAREFLQQMIERYDFQLFTRGSFMSDVSILSMAVMDGAVRGLGNEEASRVEIAKSIRYLLETSRTQAAVTDGISQSGYKATRWRSTTDSATAQ